VTGIDPGWLSTASLLGLAVLSVLRGWLVPARWVDRALSKLEADNAYWRSAYERERDRADVAAQQVDTLTTQYSATMQVFARAALPPPLPLSGEQ
jgi:hypothetical protein